MEEFPQPDNSPEEADDKEQPSKAERLQLAQELQESGETFSFSGIGSEDYENLKAAESGVPPELITPIDELIARFKKEGIKVALGKNPDSGNIFVLPGQSPADDEDIKENSIFPRHLQITEDMDERLKRLIQTDKDKDL